MQLYASLSDVGAAAPSLTLVGGPLAVKQGRPESRGFIHVMIYQLPDRFFLAAFLLNLLKGCVMNKRVNLKRLLAQLGGLGLSLALLISCQFSPGGDHDPNDPNNGPGNGGGIVIDPELDDEEINLEVIEPNEEVDNPRLVVTIGGIRFYAEGGTDREAFRREVDALPPSLIATVAPCTVICVSLSEG